MTPPQHKMDGSSGTRQRKDGTGSRCLKDFVVKGKIETLNLVRLVLRFYVGIFAVTEDLSLFYYSVMLLLQQWNMQRFVLRENLDPNNLSWKALLEH